jgi:hypothetical protein
MFKSPEITKESIAKAALPQSAWRPVRDEELEAAIDELTKLVSKREASKPTWTRRLGVLTNGGGFVVSVDVPRPVLMPEWQPHPEGVEPAVVVVGYAMRFAVSLLQSDLSPEIELAARRAQQAKFNAEQAKKRAAEAAALEAKRQARAKLEQEARDYRAEDWKLLSGLQRFAARLALAVEPRDSKLAADLRGIVAQSLAGDEPDTFPRGNWFAGLGLDGLSPQRRQDLVRAAQGERENIAIEEIPRDKLPPLRAMNGSDNRAGIVAHWRRILRANQVAAPPRSTVSREVDLGEA